MATFQYRFDHSLDVLNHLRALEANGYTARVADPFLSRREVLIEVTSDLIPAEAHRPQLQRVERPETLEPSFFISWDGGKAWHPWKCDPRYPTGMNEPHQPSPETPTMSLHPSHREHSVTPKLCEAIPSTADERVTNNVVRHEYRVLSDVEKAQMLAIKDQGLAFLNLLTDLSPSREVSIAKTKIEEAVMWAVKSITR